MRNRTHDVVERFTCVTYYYRISSRNTNTHTKTLIGTNGFAHAFRKHHDSVVGNSKQLRRSTYLFRPQYTHGNQFVGLHANTFNVHMISTS